MRRLVDEGLQSDDDGFACVRAFTDGGVWTEVIVHRQRRLESRGMEEQDSIRTVPSSATLHGGEELQRQV